ncbi:MAG: hypothetical protein ACRC9L_09900 [Brevinema sp.]
MIFVLYYGMKILFVVFLLAMCGQSESVNFQYEVPIPVLKDEKSLNAVLKKEFPLDALAIARAYPQFWSKRVKLLILEYLVDTADYEEAILLGRGLLLLETESSEKAIPSASTKKPRRSGSNSSPKNSKERLSESQRHKIYFYLAMAYWGADKPHLAEEFFAQTEQRPNYFYYYRYAQFASEQKDWEKALSLFEQSYSRSAGRFSYINEAFASFLVNYAIDVRQKNALLAEDLLKRILNNPHFAQSSAAAKAKVRWKQYQPIFRVEQLLKTPASSPLPQNQ